MRAWISGCGRRQLAAEKAIFWGSALVFYDSRFTATTQARDGKIAIDTSKSIVYLYTIRIRACS